MILSNYSTARARFTSEIESLRPLVMTGPDVIQNMTIIVKDIKSFIGYLSVVHTREPILKEFMEMQTLEDKPASETLDYLMFLETTKLNDKLTFYFQPSTFVNKVPLIFNDNGLLGEKNIYKPFGSSESRSVDSMLTESIDGIRQFSDDYFKFKHYRGLVAFERVPIHQKGYTIYLQDKKLYITIIAAKHTDKSNSYVGIMYSGD